MKKTLVVVATAIGVILLGNVVLASAQGNGPDGRPAIGQATDMHEAVLTAVAQELGMTYDELVAALQSGQTLSQIAADKGVSIERLREVMLEAREAALADLVEQGVITQDQADWMLSHANGMYGFGGGFGDCDGMAGFGGHGPGMMGGRGMHGNFNPTAPRVNPAAPSNNG